VRSKRRAMAGASSCLTGLNYGAVLPASSQRVLALSCTDERRLRLLIHDVPQLTYLPFSC
jgi:hypothetical protein